MASRLHSRFIVASLAVVMIALPGIGRAMPESVRITAQQQKWVQQNVSPTQRSALRGVARSIAQEGVLSNSSKERLAGQMRSLSTHQNVDVAALVQWVLRESYRMNTEDVRSYAEKAKHYNDLKKQLRQAASQGSVEYRGRFAEKQHPGSPAPTKKISRLDIGDDSDGALQYQSLNEMAKAGIRDRESSQEARRAAHAAKMKAKKRQIGAEEDRIRAEREAAGEAFTTASVAAAVTIAGSAASLGNQPLGTARDTFPAPKHQGRRLDWCRSFGKGCGADAATAWCRTKGYARSNDFKQAPDIGARTPTVTLADRKICSAQHCDGFAHITCAH